jgi:hypothetical protein
MRCGLVVLAFAVCSCSTSATASARPAWPRSATREVDGGESLAPRAAARAIAAIAEDDRPADKAAADKPAAASSTPGASPAADKPAASASAAVTAEEPITTEDIVIEIED